MTICCSDLANDQDMIRALGDLAVPMPLWTDCAFGGVGEDDKDILIAVERKKIADICQCINDGRFLFQAQVCNEMGADVLALIVEGRCRSNPDTGLLEVPSWGPTGAEGRMSESWSPGRPEMSYSRFDQYLTELTYLAGIIVKRSADVAETAAIISALHDNFQKPPSKHGALHQIFSAPPRTIELYRPGIVRRMAKELTGVGWERSRVIADRFKTPMDMCLASRQDWLDLPGIGKKLASDIMKELSRGADAKKPTNH